MEDASNSDRYKRLVTTALVLLVSFGCHNVKEPVSKLGLADDRTSNQLLSGFWWVEANSWRWTAREFSVALQPPYGAERTGATLYLRLYIPDSQIESLGPMMLGATVEGQSLQPETFEKGGSYIYTREIPKVLLATSILPVKFCFDKALPGEKSDGRELGAIVTGIELQAN
jgi:hypothetical protein